MVDTGRFYRAAKETLGNGNGHEVRVMGDGKILVLRCLMDEGFKTAGELARLWGVSENQNRRLPRKYPSYSAETGTDRTSYPTRRIQEPDSVPLPLPHSDRGHIRL